MTDYDIDTRMYQQQEAASLAKSGWTVWPPEEDWWEPLDSLCRGVDDEGCMVRTPNVRCRFCNKTRRIRRTERGWAA